MISTGRQANFFEQFQSPGTDILLASQLQGNHNVFQSSECRQQLEILEYKSYMAVSHCRPLVFRKAVEHHIIEFY